MSSASWSKSHMREPMDRAAIETVFDGPTAYPRAGVTLARGGQTNYGMND
ncbi:uncharacterized protein G2W53_025286 [Senna tora]|uniref:Uncharacterized protein n=1 Tax=Senna tora TaxID=362788 RepID=A0A834WHR5_9FABA|nr:uncharacterized protein G2W53_025286 [Senna tora]